MRVIELKDRVKKHKRCECCSRIIVDVDHTTMSPGQLSQISDDNLIEGLMTWGNNQEGFDLGFIKSISEFRPRELTSKQRKALENIAVKWKVHGEYFDEEFE